MDPVPKGSPSVALDRAPTSFAIVRPSWRRVLDAGSTFRHTERLKEKVHDARATGLRSGSGDVKGKVLMLGALAVLLIASLAVAVAPARAYGKNALWQVGL